LSEVLRSYVGGDWLGGSEKKDDLSPTRPGAPIAIVEAADGSIAEEAVAAARGAAAAWRATPAPARGEILRRIGDLIEARAEALGRELAIEEGKTAWEATAEAKRAGAIFRYFAGETLQPDGETYPAATATFLFTRREPVGVVTVITPWNFPLAIPAWKIEIGRASCRERV